MANVTSTYMPSIQASFAGNDVATYLIDGNSANGYAWTTGCTQSPYLAIDYTKTNCSDAPCFATETLDISTLTGGTAYTSATSGGYTTSGTTYLNTLSITPVGATDATSATVSMNAVTKIDDDGWLFNVDTHTSGAVGFGPDSDWLLLL